ncbi:MAG: hypothetical protein GF344_00490 [Chitinivibrionales bacterium]|nr:hypothetical protein [Chitinivibrionales bacterium]MBD3355604.1 hypothetical protein [Chitinivibrionales bacterium]
MLSQEIYEALQQIPVVDIHSHLSPTTMAASDPGKILFYHMLRYPMRAAGVPEERLWRPDGDPKGDQVSYDCLIDAWPAISSTSFGWALTTILRDLYGFNEPLSRESLARFEERFKEHTGNPNWGTSVLNRAGIADILTNKTAENTAGALTDAPPRVHNALVRGFYGGTREYNSICLHLEQVKKQLGAEITSYQALKEAVNRYYEGYNWQGRHALIARVCSLADFTPCESGVIDHALASVHRGESIDEHQHSLLDAAFIRCICEAARDNTGVLQLVYGTQYLTPNYPHPVQRAGATFASTLGHLVGEFPDLHFVILNGYEPDEPLLCSLCLGYGNVSLGGFWWQTFYPSVTHAAWHRRLDMVPTSRLMGFFSDAHCVDWIYARIRMAQRVLSQVLAERIERKFYSFDQAIDVARAIMNGTPKRLLLEE